MTVGEATEASASGQGWPRVADLLRENLRKALDESFKDNQAELAKLLGSINVTGGGGGGGGFGDVGSLVEFLTATILGAVVLDPAADAGVAALTAAEGAAGKFGIGSALGYMLGYTAFSMLNPVFLPVQHAVADFAQSEIFDPETAARLQATGIISQAFGRSEAGGGNLDQPHYDDLAESAKNHPAVAELLALLNRGHLTPAQVTYHLTRLGYDAPTQAALLNLRRNLLSGADLALGLLRQDITEQEAQAYAATIGVDDNDLQILYNNTGEPPGPEQLLFLWRRGFINQARLERGIRQSRIRPEWIDAIENLRYVPMSTEEAVRAVVQSYLTEEQGKAISEQNGLLPEHWEPLRLSWGRPLSRGEMGSLVHRGLATRAQFDQAMRESDVKDKYINAAFETTRHLIPIRELIDAIKYGAMTMKEGAKRLMQQGYSQDDTAILLKLGLREASGSTHALTQSQIVTLYKDGIMSRPDTKNHLTALGYSPQDAEFLLQTVDIQAHVAEVRAETSTIRVNYLAGGIDAATAEKELQQIGLSAAQAAHNIVVWNREKRRAAKNLSESQIVKAAKTGTYTYDQASDLLVAIGYSKADANTLLASNSVLPVATQERDIIAAAKAGTYTYELATELLMQLGLTKAEAEAKLNAAGVKPTTP